MRGRRGHFGISPHYGGGDCFSPGRFDDISGISASLLIIAAAVILAMAAPAMI